MTHGTQLFIGVAVLAAGTYALRLAGPLLRSRITVSDNVRALIDRAALVLLVAVAATGALYAGQDLSGWALPAGVAAGVVAALLKAPLIVVILLAAGVAAGLRAAGVG